jgi:hypothetical protein
VNGPDEDVFRPDEGFRLREAVRNAIIRIVRDRGGEVAERTIYGGTAATDMTVPEPGPPLVAIRAARLAEHAARAAVERHVKYARQDGRTWKDIGEAMGFTSHPGEPPIAESAFRVVAPGTSDYNLIVGWVCPSCRQVVRDYGPYEANPAEAERGHGDGCARLAAAVAEYKRQWGGDK